MKIIYVLLANILLVSNLYSQYNNENFDSFFYNFSTDKEFQLERIKFPLEFITWKDEGTIGSGIETKTWTHDFFYMNESSVPQVYDNFEGKLKDTDERLFNWIGVETGVNVKYYFKRIDGLWHLIKKENLVD